MDERGAKLCTYTKIWVILNRIGSVSIYSSNDSVDTSTIKEGIE